MMEARTLNDVPVAHALNMQTATECVANFHGLQDWVRVTIGYDGDASTTKKFRARDLFSREWWRGKFAPAHP